MDDPVAKIPLIFTDIVAFETIALTKKMANENHLWGAEHIRGDLEFLIDDRVDRQVATFDLGTDVVYRDTSKSA